MNGCLRLVSFMKKKSLKLFALLLIICLCSIICGCSNKEQINYDFDTYLSGESDFEKNISIVMPSKEDLANAEVIYYMSYDNGETSEMMESKMIRLTVKYSENDFLSAVETLKQQFELHNNETMSSRFYYNGILYEGFIFNDNGYCALAYNICSDSNAISYMAFDCWDLEFMDVELALGNFPQFQYENQIRLEE